MARTRLSSPRRARFAPWFARWKRAHADMVARWGDGVRAYALVEWDALHGQR